MYHLMKKLTSFFVGVYVGNDHARPGDPVRCVWQREICLVDGVLHGAVFYGLLGIHATGKKQTRQSQKGGETICRQIKRAIQRGR